MTEEWKRRAASLSLILLFYVVPALPCYAGLIGIKFPYAPIAAGILAIAVGVFGWEQIARARRSGFSTAFLMVTAWLPTIALAAWLRRYFPGVEFVAPMLAMALYVARRAARNAVRIPVEWFICVGGYSLVHGYFREMSWLLALVVVAVFSVGLALYGLLERSRGELIPRWLYLSFISGVSVVGTLSFHSYTATHPEAADGIAAQPGVRQLSEYDRQDINFFIDDGAGNGWRFYHHVPDYCSYRGGMSDACREEKWRPSDEAVWDADARAYWFFSGPKLWRMRPGDPKPEPMGSFDDEFRRLNPVFAGGNIRGFPLDRPTRFLAQYDEAPGVVYFDLDQRSARAIEVGDRNTDCIWSPDGNSIVFLGSNKASLRPLRGKLTKTDLDGRVLRERYIDDVVSYLTQTDRSYFYISYYSRHRVEKVSYDSLETIDSVETDRYPRSAYHDSARGLLIVPSFLDGTLSFYRSEGLEFLMRIRIGTRVRAVTESLSDGSILIASSAGQFSVDIDEVLLRSAQPDRPGMVEAGEPL
ncbi:MAG: hypothetical protein KJ042_03195 [Deltaproteobacteria bacterium]|nr:hypothetical protein [Deltaproteobacteria bacterium]